MSAQVEHILILCKMPDSKAPGCGWHGASFDAHVTSKRHMWCHCCKVLSAGFLVERL